MKTITMMMAICLGGILAGCSSRSYTAESVIEAQREYNAKQGPLTPSSTPSTAAPMAPAAPNKPVDQTYNQMNSRHWVSIVLDRGDRVKLEDNSIWEVSPSDTFKTRLWSVASTIIVVNGGNSNYPFRLTNADKNETIDARLVSQ